ncbi:hypothetical protein [Rhodocytophaga rosea]|nr:hypothetical protein [Rhodocytophaga rosea]
MKKSNITFGTLKGKLIVASDCWDDDLKDTEQKKSKKLTSKIKKG